jgi:hypothetical protein
VRIHADSAEPPFDLNSGAKLQLGRPLKMRTMITYLTIIAELHDSFARCRSRIDADRRRSGDPLTGGRPAISPASRDVPAADARRGECSGPIPRRRRPFFTGGGNQSFGNFESWEIPAAPTVENAFQHSINLAFVRILRDDRQLLHRGQRCLGQALLATRRPAARGLSEALYRYRQPRFLYRFYSCYKG